MTAEKKDPKAAEKAPVEKAPLKKEAAKKAAPKKEPAKKAAPKKAAAKAPVKKTAPKNNVFLIALTLVSMLSKRISLKKISIAYNQVLHLVKYTSLI